MYGLLQHDDCHSSVFRLRIDYSFYELYDITDLNFASNFHLKVCFCFLIQPKYTRRYKVPWSYINVIWSLKLLHCPYTSCIPMDTLSCLTLWSLKSRTSWHIAQLVHKFLLLETNFQNQLFGYIFLLHPRSRHQVVVPIRFLYGNQLGMLYAVVIAYGFNQLCIHNLWQIEHHTW